MSLSSEELTDMVATAFQQFDQMTVERHLKGQTEYGQYTFLGEGKNLIGEAMEEIADASNYLRYLFAKLYILDQVLAKALEDEEVQIGPQAMKKTIN